MKKRTWSIFYGIFLLLFTVYIVLDTFVIANTYQTDANQMNLELFKQLSEEAEEESTVEVIEEETDLTAAVDITAAEESAANLAAVDAEYVFQDENSFILINEYEVNNTAVYVADVQLSSVQYLKTAFAQDSYGKNVTETTSTIAADHQAILAINGDYYGVQESGYVIRNGVIYRSESNGEDVLCIYADGSMEVLDSDEYTAQELLDRGVWQLLCFGPGLLAEGEIAVDTDEEVDRARSSNPRTAIGITRDGHYIFVVSDGRTEESEGLTLYELAEFMQSLGCITAYNLDGGGSSTMVFQGQLINQPTTTGKIKERSVSDIVYIG